MTRWLLRRLIHAAATFLVVTILLFLLMRIAPGDPLSRLVDQQQMSAEEMAVLRARFGLDQPLGRQFLTFVTGLPSGNMGVSIEHYPDRVSTLLRERLAPSLLLGGVVLVLNFTLGIWLGVLQATHRGSGLDRWLTRLSLAGYSLPSFWLALMLVALVSLQWQLLPAAQMTDPLLSAEASWWERAADIGRHLILPALTLSIVSLATTMRYQRTAMLEVMRLDFVRAASARGLSSTRVRWRHAWRNALFPLLTLLGLWLPFLVTGSVFVEAIFNWPGIGSLAAEAILGRDYPLLQGTAMLAAALVLAGNLLADLGHLLLDPRTRTT